MVLTDGGITMRERRGGRDGKVPWVEGDPFRGSVWGEGGRRRGSTVRGLGGHGGHGELLLAGNGGRVEGSGRRWRARRGEAPFIGDGGEEE
jgi:hypothetical protein